MPDHHHHDHSHDDHVEDGLRYIGEEDLGPVVLESAVPVLVDFTASWCPPCKVQKPIVRALGERLGDRARVVAVDVDASPELAERYGVRSIPTLVVFRGGAEVQRFRGLTSEPVLASALTA